MNTHRLILCARILFCACLALPLAGCSDSDEDSQAGEWAVTFSGTATGSASMFIDSGGAFDFDVTLSDAGRAAAVYRVKGKLYTNGREVVGKMYEGTEEAGLFHGYMASSRSGYGNWSVGSGAGTPRGEWTALKR